jgi:hypothetical protein
MRHERTTQGFRIHLLALILALALLWYSINPAPYTITRDERKEPEPDAKKRQLEPAINRTPPALLFHQLHRREPSDAFHQPDEETDDFEWPEFIDG